MQVSDSDIAYLKDATWVEKPARLFQRLLSETIRSGGTRLVVAEGDLGYTAANKLSGRLLDMGYDAASGGVVVRYDAEQRVTEVFEDGAWVPSWKSRRVAATKKADLEKGEDQKGL